MANFEDFIRQSAQDYKVSYNEEHWKQIEKQLPSDKKGQAKKYWVAGAAIAVVGIAALMWNSTREVQQPQPPVTIPLQTPENAPLKKETPQVEMKAAPAAEIPVESTEVTNKENVTSKPKETTPKEKPSEIIIPEVKEEKPTTSGMAFTFASDRAEGCLYETISFNADISEPVTYRWNFGDGTESTLPQPKHAYAKPGTYTVSLEVTSILSGKSKRELVGEMVTIHPKPYADFDFDVLAPEDFNQNVVFDASEQNYTDVQWLVAGKSFDKERFTLPMNKKGNYPVTIITSNKFGCYDTLTRNVVIDQDYNLMAPNAFTPDNDGLNDVFLPKALESSSLRYDLQIMEAGTGAIVFQGNQDSKGWNGVDRRTGQRAKQGAYAWMVQLYLPSGELEKFQGTLQLLEM